MTSAVPKNFDPAHVYFSQALVALSNPFSVAFSDARNTTVSQLKMLKAICNEGNPERIHASHSTITNVRERIKELLNGGSAISELRAGIEGMMNKAPMEPRADIFMDVQSDSSKEDDWENIGSDEEVIG